MEARDLSAAKAFLADGFRMTFPGDNTFDELAEYVAWAAPRYQAVTKTHDGLRAKPRRHGGLLLRNAPRRMA